MSIDERNEETMAKLYTNMMVDGHLKDKISATYTPPVSITETLNELYSKISVQYENEIAVNVSKQIGVDVDRERLLKAMNADKELYSLQQRLDFLERCMSRACQLLYGFAQISHEPSDAAARRKPIDWKVYIVDQQIRADSVMRNLVKIDTNDEEGDTND